MKYGAVRKFSHNNVIPVLEQVESEALLYQDSNHLYTCPLGTLWDQKSYAPLFPFPVLNFGLGSLIK